MTAKPKPYILVVDDNPSNRKLAQEFLKLLDVNSETAESGEQALEKYSKTEFDLILMDLQMPGLNGFETTASIRSREGNKRRTPIVALTAESVEEQKVQFLLEDMDDFLSKPLSESDLKNTVDRWLNSPLYTTFEHGAITHSEQAPPQKESKDERPTAPQKATVFNLSESLRLSKQLPDLAADMLNFLLGSLNDTKLAINKALNENDLETLLEVIHKFHGGCCYCGVPRLKNTVKNLETTLNNPEDKDIKAMTYEVLEEMDSLQIWAEEHDIDALFLDI